MTPNLASFVPDAWTTSMSTHGSGWFTPGEPEPEDTPRLSHFVPGLTRDLFSEAQGSVVSGGETPRLSQFVPSERVQPAQSGSSVTDDSPRLTQFVPTLHKHRDLAWPAPEEDADLSHLVPTITASLTSPSFGTPRLMQFAPLRYERGASASRELAPDPDAVTPRLTQFAPLRSESASIEGLAQFIPHERTAQTRRFPPSRP